MLPILNQSLWRDEAFSALLSAKYPLQIISLTMRDTSPPLYYLLLHYWMRMFGSSEVALRGLSFLFHLFTVFIVFLITKKLIKSAPAALSIAFTALLNPFLLQYAFEARAYSLLAFLSILAVYLAISKKYLFTSLILALAIFTHNYAVFTFIAFAGWFAYIHRKELSKKGKEILELLILPILALLIWGAIIWQQWVKVAGDFWIKPSTYSLFLSAFEKFSRGELSYPARPMLFTFTLVLCFIASGFWLWRERKVEKSENLLLITFLIFIPTFITYIISALFVPIFYERYLIAEVPLLIILIGYSIYRLFEVNPKVRNIIIACVAFYMLILVQSSQEIVAMSTKAPINWAVSQILSYAVTGDVIIPQSNLNFLETKWYVQQSGSPIPVYTHSPSGSVPFYIGGVLFEPMEIITQMPKGQRVWQIKSDGGYGILSQ